jgi:hypothetical protein
MYLAAEKKASLLRADICQEGKRRIQKRKKRHQGIHKCQQIQQAFNAVSAAEHIISKSPEFFLFIVSSFDMPSKSIDSQRKQGAVCFCITERFTDA